MQALPSEDFPALGDNSLPQQQVEPSWDAFHPTHSQQDRPAHTLVTVQQQQGPLAKQEPVQQQSDSEEEGGRF